jgi:hypothetical protein
VVFIEKDAKTGKVIFECGNGCFILSLGLIVLLKLNVSLKKTSYWEHFHSCSFTVKDSQCSV